MPTVELTDDQADRLEKIVRTVGDAALIAAVVAARQRAVGLRQCQQCGEWFAGIVRATYCGPTCRTAAYRQRVLDWRRRAWPV